MNSKRAGRISSQTTVGRVSETEATAKNNRVDAKNQFYFTYKRCKKNEAFDVTYVYWKDSYRIRPQLGTAGKQDHWTLALRTNISRTKIKKTRFFFLED